MKMVIEFNDDELREMYEKNKEILEQNTEMLNRLSHDIKLMDSLLKGKVSEKYVFLAVGNGRMAWSGECVEYHIGSTATKLIECKKEIRIMCKPFLSTFLKLCIEKIGEI